MSETSPRPWRWNSAFGDRVAELRDANNQHVLEAEGPLVVVPLRVSPADAALIVHAVNHHDELVAALEQCLGRCGDLAVYVQGKRIEPTWAVQARALLERARKP